MQFIDGFLHEASVAINTHIPSIPPSTASRTRCPLFDAHTHYAGGMKTQHDLAALAANYHKALPGRIRQYLNNRGITDPLIDFHLLGWNGNRITIPIYNRDGEMAFFKLARDPDDTVPGPKMLNSPGAYAEIYAWGALLREPSRIIICEGEFDRMVLEANAFVAVTSTAGAGVFMK